MSSKANVHVISKSDIKQHTVVSLSISSLPQLQDGHVRVRAAIVSLTNNNHSYALLGEVRHWWDTYPVPEGLSAPHNDTSQYGIVPTWGYGEVLESKVFGIEPGMLLWGYWPSHDLPVDLELVPADATGQWMETSESRKRLMSLYQRYILPDPGARLTSLGRTRCEEMAWEAAVRPVWEAGYLLNAAIFGRPPIHPSDNGKWDENDADLGSAVVVSLSASGKTARGFTDGLINHRLSLPPPLGLLAITSAQNKALIPEATFPTFTASYDTIISEDTLSWIAQRKPSKIIVVDFGGRGDSPSRLIEALETKHSQSEIVIIGVGGNVQISTPQELGQWAQSNMTRANRVQMNTSDLRDAVIKRSGADAYFENLTDAWHKFINSESTSDLKLEMGQGVAGDEGFEGGWTRLCDGRVPSEVAMGFQF